MPDPITQARALPIWDGVIDNATHGLDPGSLTEVARFALTLADLTDDELFDASYRWILNSAIMNGSRRPVPDHAMCDLCCAEADRRNPSTPQNEDGTIARTPSIYTRAHDAVMADQGHRT